MGPLKVYNRFEAKWTERQVNGHYENSIRKCWSGSKDRDLPGSGGDPCAPPLLHPQAAGGPLPEAWQAGEESSKYVETSLICSLFHCAPCSVRTCICKYMLPATLVATRGFFMTYCCLFDLGQAEYFQPERFRYRWYVLRAFCIIYSSQPDQRKVAAFNYIISFAYRHIFCWKWFEILCALKKRPVSSCWYHGIKMSSTETCFVFTIIRTYTHRIRKRRTSITSTYTITATTAAHPSVGSKTA